MAQTDYEATAVDWVVEWLAARGEVGALDALGPAHGAHRCVARVELARLRHAVEVTRDYGAALDALTGPEVEGLFDPGSADDVRKLVRELRVVLFTNAAQGWTRRVHRRGRARVPARRPRP